MTDRKRIVVVGAGGFAREVRWLIEEINAVRPRFDFLGYVVSDLAKLGEHDSREAVLGDLGWLRAAKGHVDAAAIGIGNPAVRLRLSEELVHACPWLDWPSLVHPSVRFDSTSCNVGRGALLCAGTIGTVNVSFQDFCLVNLSCTIGHESVVGRGSVLNPTVNISGGVSIGEGVLVGTGAQILQYIAVGTGATVGSGAVVTKDVPPATTVVGIPAKPLQRASQA
ncbi:MAG: acetyltransferase [Thermoanaerobaculia bacterium]